LIIKNRVNQIIRPEPSLVEECDNLAGGGSQGDYQIGKGSMVQANLNIKVFDIDVLIDSDGGGCSCQIPNEGVGWGVGEVIGGK